MLGAVRNRTYRVWCEWVRLMRDKLLEMVLVRIKKGQDIQVPTRGTTKVSIWIYYRLFNLKRQIKIGV